MVNDKTAKKDATAGAVIKVKTVKSKSKVPIRKNNKNDNDDLNNDDFNRALKDVTERYDRKLQDFQDQYDLKFKELQESIISESYFTDKLNSEGQKTKDIFRQQLNILPSLVSNIVDNKNKQELEKLKIKTELMQKEIDNQLMKGKSTYSKSDFLASFLHVCEHLNLEDELRKKSTLTKLRYIVLNIPIFIMLLGYILRERYLLM